MRVHVLKVWPAWFLELRDRSRTFELRRDDRDFAIGDELELREFVPSTWDVDGERWLGRFTGRSERRTITSLTRGPVAGLEAGFVILSLGESRSPSGHPQLQLAVSHDRIVRLSPRGAHDQTHPAPHGAHP